MVVRHLRRSLPILLAAGLAISLSASFTACDGPPGGAPTARGSLTRHDARAHGRTDSIADPHRDALTHAEDYRNALANSDARTARDPCAITCGDGRSPDSVAVRGSGTRALRRLRVCRARAGRLRAQGVGARRGH